jgi:hypothetical protein
MAGSGIVILVVLLFAIAVPIGLWLLVESETDGQRTMDRTSAEQAARADTWDAAQSQARQDYEDNGDQ